MLPPGDTCAEKAAGKGFTLIELLVVVTIISILSAIALPNFLEAQTRSKVAAAKNNMRVVAGQLEMYHVDYGKYPVGFTEFFSREIETGAIGFPNGPGDFDAMIVGNVLGPGSAECSSQRLDPFLRRQLQSALFAGGLVYLNHGFMVSQLGPESDWTNREPENWRLTYDLAGEWSLHSVGPSGYEYGVCDFRVPGASIEMDGCYYHGPPYAERTLFREYDPTNGTVSAGGIFRTQKNPAALGYRERFYSTQADGRI